MEITLNETERVALTTAAARERRVRHGRRLRAIQLLAEHEHPTAVAWVLGCSLASVYKWATAWQTAGLGTDPQSRGYHATGWTVPLLRTELAQAGYSVSPRTIRRTLHRLGWRWKRPKYVLGRPDPEYGAKKGGDCTGSSGTGRRR